MKKYRITIEFKSDELRKEVLDEECRTLENEFLESDLYNLHNLNVSWRDATWG